MSNTARSPAGHIWALLALFPALLAAQPAPTAQQDGTVKFESRVNVVLVPVLVRDAQGYVIGDLNKEDFQLFDRGKRQSISYFTVQKRASERQDRATADASPEGHAQQAPTAGQTQSARVAAERFIVFLFDDLHLVAGDLARIRSAANRVIADSVKSSDAAAVVSTSGQVNSGFTRDKAKLEDAVGKLALQTSFAQTRDCPDVSYYEANLIINMSDKDTLDAATADARNCAGLIGGPDALRNGSMAPLPEELARSAAQRELARVEQATHTTLVAIRAVVRSIGAAHGQRMLILVSPGFLVPSSAVAQADLSKLMDAAAQANVTISALDARGLYTNVLDSSARDVLPSDVDRNGKYSRRKEQNRRDSLTEDGAVMEELTASTGGTYFHNSNDLEGGFQRVTMAPECVYLLEFSPQNVRRDGSFHRLSVKVNRKGAKVQARPGYFSEKTASETSQ
jgi:VWFA-related protein